MHIPIEVQRLLDAGATFVVNHSGGKDSQAMLAKLLTVIPHEQLEVVHAELPEADWSGIPEHIEATLGELPEYKVHYTRAAKTFFEMVERRNESRPDAPCWPSPSTRQCTSDLKRDPIAKWLRAHAKAHGRRLYVHCIGIRAEESASRAKAKVFKANKRESKAGRQVFEWLPIFDMTEREVFGTIRDAGQEPHWAYGAGMTRLSCAFCVMASKRDLQTAARLRPETYQRIRELETRTGWAFSPSGKTLDVIIEEQP